MYSLYRNIGGNDFMTKKILDKNYILSKYDIIKANKHRLPVSLDFTKAENDFIRTNFQSIEKLYVYFGDQPTHGNVWIPDDIYITEIQQLAQELGYPPHSVDYPRSASAIHRFKRDWKGVLQIAGIKATFCSAQSRVSKEEILYKSRQVFENSNMNYLPAWKELKRLGVPVASIYLYWNKVEDYRKELGIPSRAEWEWQVRSACLEDATIKLINASDNCPITIKSLVNQSRLKRWEIARIIKQYGGLNKYITAISNK